jgi:hypothetical protein
MVSVIGEWGPVSPVELRIAAIAERIGKAEGLTAGSLIESLGSASYPMVILVLSVLNMLPGPPGYGGTLALAMIGVTLAMLLGRPLQAGGWVGRRRLPRPLLARMVRQLQWLARLIGRISRQRLGALTGPGTEWLTGLFILLVSLPMVLPIPFINAVPNTGIAVLCVSRINRDGLGVLLGGLIALVGMGIAIGAVWATALLARSVMGA